MTDNIAVGRYQVRQIMQEFGLRPVWKKAFMRTTDSQHKLPITHNLLDQRFNPTIPNQAWVGDITYMDILITFYLMYDNGYDNTQALKVLRCLLFKNF